MSLNFSRKNQSFTKKGHPSLPRWPLFRATLLSVLNLASSLIAFAALAIGGRGVEVFGIEKVFLGIGALVAVLLIVLIPQLKLKVEAV